MADATKIEWADATFNPWVGCANVSPGCGHCYARTWAKRTGSDVWLDSPRRVTSAAIWRGPEKWAKLARKGKLPDGTENVDGHRPRIFCASLADVFEDRLELVGPRTRLFNLIADTHELDWLILTKRPDVALDFWRTWDAIDDEYNGPGFKLWPLPNVWLGVSIENSRFTWRADVLREIPAVRFISAEPLLGSLFQVPGRDPVEVLPSGSRAEPQAELNGPGGSPISRPGRAPLDLTGIDWIIVGGESGPGARPFHLEHAREIIREARVAESIRCHRSETLVLETLVLDDLPGPAVFVKQLGAKPVAAIFRGEPHFLKLADRKGGDMWEWPADLRIREFPRSAA